MTASSRDDTGPSAALLKRLEGLMALSPEDRQAELELLAATDPDLARRLQRLLSHAAEAETWLGDFEQTLARNLASELDSAWAPGRVIGPYRLERLLATGGMDAVFLARKADGELKRPVALKLVPPGLINEDTLARFRQERDLLAALAHPNIAQLLDAGITDAGQPWFAMEFIDGSRFLDWCRQETGGLEARVRRFLDLVDAVQFAHRNLVVHGDIKPGNVMVDRNGRLRLLDFGIARLLNEVPADGAVRYFTARYAAPEVSAGQGATISSDIYSLGVMLAELIDLPDSASSPSRSSPPADELRCIAERATRDDPSDRYESARQIGDEIRRWLRFEPVDAWQGGALYRFGKRVRRHPWASVGITAALVVVIGFGGYSRIQAERFAAQRDSARQLAEFMEQVSWAVIRRSRATAISAHGRCWTAALKVWDPSWLPGRPLRRCGHVSPRSWGAPTSVWAITRPPGDCWKKRWIRACWIGRSASKPTWNWPTTIIWLDDSKRRKAPIASSLKRRRPMLKRPARWRVWRAPCRRPDGRARRSNC